MSEYDADVHEGEPLSGLEAALTTAQRESNPETCERLLRNALVALRADPESVDNSVFEMLGPIVGCAGVSSICNELAREYLQMVTKFCSGREVLTVVMAQVDSRAGYVHDARQPITHHPSARLNPSVFHFGRNQWHAQDSLLCQTAVSVICSLQRQQTRLLADYLQVLLSSIRSANISDTLLESLHSTLFGLRPVMPHVSKMQHAQENQLLIRCFTLQLILHTLTVPLQQIRTFHSRPGFNLDPASQQQSGHSKLQSALYTKLVQEAMQSLHALGNGHPAQLSKLLHSVQHLKGTSKLPSCDDESFLDIDELQVSTLHAIVIKSHVFEARSEIGLQPQSHAVACLDKVLAASFWCLPLIDYS